jgi:hypothetical protein
VVGSSVADPRFPGATPEELREGAVSLAYVYDGASVDYSFHKCLIELMGFDMASECRVMRGGFVVMKCATNGLVEARNNAVKLFLEEDTADWLLWLDTDMGFAPDTLDRLMAVADPVSRPIVGALAFTSREDVPDGLGGWRTAPTPTVFQWGERDGETGFVIDYDYPRDELVRCAGTGSACILIHRSVFEAVAAEVGPIWYDRFENPTSKDRYVGEDLSFCLRAVAAGFPVHVDTRVKTTHQKLRWIGEEDYVESRVLDRLRHPVAPPATEPTAVVVPVMRRPQNAKPFMESLRASGADLATVYAVCDVEDIETRRAWREAGAQVETRDFGDDEIRPGTFAEKVNAGYEFTARHDNEPWLLLVGDDVRFHPGWLDHAQHAARDGAHVIGTNDLHNPRVMAGEHATHLLVRRSYVDEVGASWDGPKVLCHEGYGHWFVDDEIVTVAKDRGVWAFAPHARIEHLHPLWGLAEDDEVYGLGQSHAEADRALFEARLRQHGG